MSGDFDYVNEIVKLVDENHRLRDENDRLNEWTLSFESTRGHYANKDNVQKDRIQALERLLRYADFNHLVGCRAVGRKVVCACGLDDAKRKAKYNIRGRPDV